MCLSDYRAVEDVFEGLGDDLAGRTPVVLCTGSPEEASAAHRRAATSGIEYLDGGVRSAPETIGTAAGRIVLSGSERGFGRHDRVLDLLGGVAYVGPDPRAAAVWDLALFGIWYDAQLGLLPALAGADVAAFARAAAAQIDHVVGSAEATAREVAARNHRRGPADLTEHLPVLDRLLRLRSGTTMGAGGLDHVRTLVTQLIDEGRAGEGLTAVLDAGSPVVAGRLAPG